MRVGGRRRLFVPPNKIPESQMANVPKDQSDEGLRIEIELLGTVTGPAALIPSILPPGNRRLVILRAIFFLSFLPYLLPEEIKPALWQSGDVAARRTKLFCFALKTYAGQNSQRFFPERVCP